MLQILPVAQYFEQDHPVLKRRQIEPCHDNIFMFPHVRCATGKIVPESFVKTNAMSIVELASLKLCMKEY